MKRKMKGDGCCEIIFPEKKITLLRVIPTTKISIRHTIAEIFLAEEMS